MRFGFRSLKWRIAAWTALILLSMQIGALLLFAQIGRTSALAEVGIQLDTGNRVFARLIDQRSAQLAQAARVLAAQLVQRFAQTGAACKIGNGSTGVGQHGVAISVSEGGCQIREARAKREHIPSPHTLPALPRRCGGVQEGEQQACIALH